LKPTCGCSFPSSKRWRRTDGILRECRCGRIVGIFERLHFGSRAKQRLTWRLLVSTPHKQQFHFDATEFSRKFWPPITLSVYPGLRMKRLRTGQSAGNRGPTGHNQNFQHG
jgi:hypothetical protein